MLSNTPDKSTPEKKNKYASQIISKPNELSVVNGLGRVEHMSQQPGRNRAQTLDIKVKPQKSSDA